MNFNMPVCSGVASVTGNGHKKGELPNQDAYSIFVSHNVVAVAVADGLGSKKASHEGARWAAYLGVQYTTDYLLTQPSSPVDRGLNQLKFSILQSWRARFGESYSDYDTTLAFVAFTPTRCIRGQLGDGLILSLCNDGSTPQAFIEPEKEFQNITSSLSYRNALNCFRLEETVAPIQDEIGAFFLMTDGIADDIEDRQVFSESLLRLLADSDQHWNVALETPLLKWPTPGHQDDKTLAVIALNHPRNLLCTEQQSRPAEKQIITSKTISIGKTLSNLIRTKKPAKSMNLRGGLCLQRERIYQPIPAVTIS